MSPRGGGHAGEEPVGGGLGEEHGEATAINSVIQNCLSVWWSVLRPVDRETKQERGVQGTFIV